MSYGEYDFRDPNVEDYIRFEKELRIAQNVGGVKQEFKILQMECTMAAGATMAAVDAGRTNELDGGTGVGLSVISDDGDDEGTTGVGLRTIKFLYTHTADGYTEETVTMNGTTSVDIAASADVNHVIAAKAVTAGSGKTSSGNITFHEAGTGVLETYLTIPAGQIATAQVGKCYVPDGWKGMILEIQGYYVQTANADAVKLTEGANFWVKWVDGLLTADEVHIYSLTNTNPLIIKPHFGVKSGGDDRYFEVMHQSVDTDNTANVFHYDVTYLLWKEA